MKEKLVKFWNRPADAYNAFCGEQFTYGHIIIGTCAVFGFIAICALADRLTDLNL